MSKVERSLCVLPALVLVPLIQGDADWSFLPGLVEEVRAEVGAPGMAVAVAHGDAVVAQAAAGVRARGAEATVTVDDRFHVGSVTKPMTASLIGILVERGTLDWEMAVGDVLPALEMREEYRMVTLDQLLTHCAGVQPFLTFDDEDDLRLQSLPGSPTEQRAAFLVEALGGAPLPGSSFAYSNAGYVLAAYAAETATGKSWERLMQELVFDPVGMVHTGTGWPATNERPDQPLGHMGSGADLQVQPIGGWDVGTFLAPAGDVHASAGDLARFGLMHARGLAGEDGLLTAATIAHLHTAPAAGSTPYGRGWFLTDEGNWHGGSAGSFYALLQVLPEHGTAVAVLANSGDTASHGAALKVVERVRAELAKGD
jgi:CubicO group peptidase (beta-lactamase class C family)